MSSKRKAKKEALVHQAAILFTKRGYYNTSIADIAQQCQLKKASIYNYIVSKEQLAQDALQQVHQTVQTTVFQFAEDQKHTTEQRLLNTLQAIETFFIEREESTLYIKLALDLAKDPAFAPKIQMHFDAWFKMLNQLLQLLGHSLEQAQAIAKQTLAELHGAVLLSEIFDNTQMIKTVCRKLYMSFKPVRAKAIA